MKKITLFKLFILLSFFAISPSYGAEVEVPIPSGTGLVWTLLDFEVANTATTTGFAGGNQILAGTGYLSSTVARPANPLKAGVNTTNTCYQWTKNNGPANFGSLAFTTNVIDKYYDLSKWQSVSIDIYMATEALTKLKVQLVDQTTSFNTTRGIAYIDNTYSGTIYPGGAWYTITINFSDLTFQNSFTDLTRVNGVMLYVNNTLGTAGTNTEIYVDNLRFNRSAPTVTTQAVSDITSTTATANGNITTLGTTNPTQYGHCWSTTTGPTISNSLTTNGAVSATGTYTSAMTNLSVGTTYYVRAYATNAAGTSYGSEVSFTTSKISQSITLSASGSKTYGDADYSPATSATSGIIPITYQSSNTSVATIVSNQIHIVGVGQTTITASQAGNASYNAATDALQTLTVSAATSSLAGGNITASGLSDAQLANTDVTVSSGEMVVNVGKSVRSITVSAGAKLSVAAGQTLTLTNLTLKSDASGTSTFVSDGTLTVSGTTVVEQYLATTRNWYVSSPVSNAVAPAGYTYYKRNEAGSSWTSVSVGNGLTAGVGYIALPGTTGLPITFTTQSGGSLNTGNITIPLTYTPSATSAKGFNLIGNPYPSHLTWTKAFVDDVTNAALIEPTIYYRTNTGTVNSGIGAAWSFITYNASTDEGTPALVAKGIIPPMQAFWVKAKATGNLILDNKLTRSHQTSNPLKAPALKNTERQRIRLQVSNGTRTDETLLLFDANATDGYDVFDSPKFDEANSEVQIYTSVGTERLVMNGMKNMPLNQEIPLGFVQGSEASFSIKANEISNLRSDVRVILKDNITKIETDLTDGLTNYQFTAEATSTNRFSLIFRSPSSPNALNEMNKLNAQVFVNANNQITIIAPEKCNYAIYNTVGQLIENGTIYVKHETRNAKLNAGVYVVKVNSQLTKVIIK